LGRRGVFLRAFKMPRDLVEFTPLPVQNHGSLQRALGGPGDGFPLSHGASKVAWISALR
jgi:hypothetical protein